MALNSRTEHPAESVRSEKVVIEVTLTEASSGVAIESRKVQLSATRGVTSGQSHESATSYESAQSHECPQCDEASCECVSNATSDSPK